jgi:hypothetical protein
LVIVLYITSFSLLELLYLLKDPMGGARMGGPEWVLKRCAIAFLGF